MTSIAAQETCPTPLATTSRWLLGEIFTKLRWFLGILAVVVLLAYPLLHFVVTDVATDAVSLWEVTGDNAPKWFLFAMGISVVTYYLGPLVAAGVTRARFASAAALALLGTAAILALVVLLGFLIEEVYGRSFGWQPVLQFGHLFTSTSQPLAVIAEYLLSGTLYAYTGLLVGFTYYRSGRLLGTLLLPFTCGVPWLLGGMLIERNGGVLPSLAGLAPSLGIGLPLLLVAAVFLLVRWLLPTTPLRAKTQ